MKSINKTIRISLEQEDFLLKNFPYVNQGIKYCIDQVMANRSVSNEQLQDIRNASKYEIAKTLTENQWLLIFETLRNTTTTGALRINPHSLIAIIVDAEKKYNIAQKYEVDLSVITSQLSKFTAAQTEALFVITEEFWIKQKLDYLQDLKNSKLTFIEPDYSYTPRPFEVTRKGDLKDLSYPKDVDPLMGEELDMY